MYGKFGPQKGTGQGAGWTRVLTAGCSGGRRGLEQWICCRVGSRRGTAYVTWAGRPRGGHEDRSHFGIPTHHCSFQFVCSFVLRPTLTMPPDVPASAFPVLELKAGATMPSLVWAQVHGLTGPYHQGQPSLPSRLGRSSVTLKSPASVPSRETTRAQRGPSCPL